MNSINIIAWNNGGGLSRDIETLVSALPPGQFDIDLNGTALATAGIQRRRIVHRAANLVRALSKRTVRRVGKYDLNLFLEDISPSFFPLARRNAFIPNPEWFRAYMRGYLGGIDVVLCKTRSAQDAFAALGSQTEVVGFTSDDRFDPGFSGERKAGFLHVAGRSWQKGTAAIVELWLKHPEWPQLTIVQNAKTYSQSSVQSVSAPNIHHILERLHDDELRQLQNTYSLHLCPSEVEGFGHCIVEAMSSGAVTLTTDAPPMNELVEPGRGVLAKYSHTSQQRLGTNYYVDLQDMEGRIEEMIAMPAAQRELLAQKARDWFESNDQRFRIHFADALGRLCQP